MCYIQYMYNVYRCRRTWIPELRAGFLSINSSSELLHYIFLFYPVCREEILSVINVKAIIAWPRWALSPLSPPVTRMGLRSAAGLLSNAYTSHAFCKPPSFLLDSCKIPALRTSAHAVPAMPKVIFTDAQVTIYDLKFFSKVDVFSCFLSSPGKFPRKILDNWIMTFWQRSVPNCEYGICFLYKNFRPAPPFSHNHVNTTFLIHLEHFRPHPRQYRQPFRCPSTGKCSASPFWPPFKKDAEWLPHQCYHPFSLSVKELQNVPPPCPTTPPAPQPPHPYSDPVAELQHGHPAHVATAPLFWPLRHEPVTLPGVVIGLPTPVRATSPSPQPPV